MTVSEIEKNNFYYALLGYGTMGLKRALETFQKAGLTHEDLADAVTEYEANTGTPIREIPVCHAAWEYVLQNARGDIKDILNFDIYGGEDEDWAYVEGFDDAQFIFDNKGMAQLQEAISNAESSKIEALQESPWVKLFFHEIGITYPKEEYR